MTEGSSYFSGKPEPQRPGAQSRAPARELAELRLRLRQLSPCCGAR